MEKLRHVKGFNESLETTETNGLELKKVKATKDESGHWYVIPNDLYDEFDEDGQNEDFVDSGEFDNKYGNYRTGGDLNNIQLYAFI